MCTHLHEVATAFHQFHEKMFGFWGADDEATRAGRLAICHLVARTLRQGLDLLGIDVIEQMYSVRGVSVSGRRASPTRAWSGGHLKRGALPAPLTTRHAPYLRRQPAFTVACLT